MNQRADGFASCGGRLGGKTCDTRVHGARQLAHRQAERGVAGEGDSRLTHSHEPGDADPGRRRSQCLFVQPKPAQQVCGVPAFGPKCAGHDGDVQHADIAEGVFVSGARFHDAGIVRQVVTGYQTVVSGYCLGRAGWLI